MTTDGTYQETIEYLFALQKHGVKLALANSHALMKAMGDPHRGFRTVHIAGTNGKGSTAAFIASMLQTAGYRVGLYTSPHLVSFTERIRINGQPISEAKVVELALRVRGSYRELCLEPGKVLNPTFFEVTTVLAFTYFAQEAVDIAVIEVGMGGRLDSTNVITPLVSVITNIDMEHTEFLGNTLEQIAAEKAGVIKPGVPVVTGASQPEVLRVLEEAAAASRSPLYCLGRQFSSRRLAAPGGPVFNYHGLSSAYDGLAVSLAGSYQVDNASLALAAVECLRHSGIEVPEDDLRQGLADARWEGRLERAALRPDIYLDGAHNPAAARVLAGEIQELKKAYRQLILIIGILGDKDVSGVISRLIPLAERVIVTRPGYTRAMDLGLLAAEVRKIHSLVDTAETVSQAIIKAKTLSTPEDLILVTGSLYVVGEARAALFPPSGGMHALSGLKG